MSIRPASSWPWLDDVLVDAGAFDDDPIVALDGADDPGSDIVDRLDAADLADLPDLVESGALDDLQVLVTGASPHAHDPFHFEPAGDREVTPDLLGGQGDPIAALFLDAIDSAPGFVADDPMFAVEAQSLTPAATDPADASNDPGAPGSADGLLTSGGLDAISLSDPTLDPSDDPAGSVVDDTSGDLDNFDGHDDLDDLDGF
jgi:hypothetical protein